MIRWAPFNGLIGLERHTKSILECRRIGVERKYFARSNLLIARSRLDRPVKRGVRIYSGYMNPVVTVSILSPRLLAMRIGAELTERL